MSTRADTISDTAPALPATERARIASELIASLDEDKDSDVEAAWATEVDRRIAEIESGEVETTSWEEVRGRIRAKLAKS